MKNMRHYFIFFFMFSCPLIGHTAITLQTKRYEGLINNQYAVSFVLYSFDAWQKGELFGYYYYQKRQAPIFVKGQKTGNQVRLVE